MTMTQQERLAILEERSINIERKIDDTNKKIDDNNKTVINLDHKVDTLLIGLDRRYDKRYASKLTQTIVFSMVGLILAGFLGFLISQAYKRPNVSQTVTTQSPSSQGTPAQSGSTTTSTTTSNPSPAKTTTSQSPTPTASSNPEPSTPTAQQPSSSGGVLSNLLGKLF